MAIVTRWDNKKKTAILLEFESEWNWEELEDAVHKADHMIGGVEHVVDLIIDLEGTTIPLDPRDVLNAAKTLLASGEARPNEGARVVVGANGAIHATYKAIEKTFSSAVKGREILFAPNMRDARAIVRGLEMDR